MTGRAVVIGGSVAGLATAVGLARKGWHATVLERDEPCPTDDGDKAFDVWDRRSVPQFLQPHLFSARSRTLLLEHIPEAVHALVDSGIEEVNLYKMLAPEETWVPEDDLFTGLQTRRPAFELAIRRVAEAEPGVEVRSPSSVTGLRFAAASAANDGVPVVDGVRLDNGEELAADAVIDAGGRRTNVPKWLAGAGVTLPEDVQDCYSTYYARYFRQHPDATLPRVMLFGVRGEIDKIRYLAGPGDTRTFSVWMTLPPRDDDYAMLRHTWAWDAVAREVPALAPWVDPSNAEPLHDVQVMAGHMNVRRHYVVDGKPLVHGVLAVGDSLCTTNPFYGWGASMALTYAFRAVEALTTNEGDRAGAALAYHALVRDEADGVYEESAAADRLWRYTVTGDPIPPDDEAAMERQRLLQAVFAGGLHDIVLGRALLRRMNLLESPRATLDDPEVVEHARQTQEILAAKAGRKRGPDRAELRAIIDAARP